MAKGTNQLKAPTVSNSSLVSLEDEFTILLAPSDSVKRTDSSCTVNRANWLMAATVSNRQLVWKINATGGQSLTILLIAHLK